MRTWREDIYKNFALCCHFCNNNEKKQKIKQSSLGRMTVEGNSWCRDLPALKDFQSWPNRWPRRTNGDTAPLWPFRKLFWCIPPTDLSAAKGFEGIVSSSLSCAVRLVATLLREFSRFKFHSYVPQGMSAAGASQHFRYSAF